MVDYETSFFYFFVILFETFDLHFKINPGFKNTLYQFTAI